MPLKLVHLIQYRPMHRQRMKPNTPHLLLHPDAGHQERYVFTMLGRLPQGGNQELEHCLKSDTISMLVDYESRSCPSNGCDVKSWTELYMRPGTVMDKYLQCKRQEKPIRQDCLKMWFFCYSLQKSHHTY
jgi:hypothetical protein